MDARFEQARQRIPGVLMAVSIVNPLAGLFEPGIHATSLVRGHFDQDLR